MVSEAGVLRFASESPGDEDLTLSRDASGVGLVYVARIPDGWAWAPSVRALWETGLVPRRWDPTGIAGVLWRGGAIDARLPAAGVRCIRPGEAWILSAAGVKAGRAVSRPPADAGMGDLIAEPDAAHAEDAVAAVLEGAVDLPSIHAARAETATRTLLALAGLDRVRVDGGVIASTGRAFQRQARRGPGRWLWGRRPRPGGDPLDVDAQRSIELETFSDIPVNWAHSFIAAFPAATREAISTVGPRPADGIVPTRTSERAVAETVRRGHVADVVFRATESAMRAGGLVDAIPLLARSALDGGGADLPHGPFGDPLPADDLGRAIDEDLRSRHAASLETVLSKARLEAQGIFRPDAVAEAIARWKGRRAGWTSERILLMAGITAWIERHGLVRAED